MDDQALQKEYQDYQEYQHYSQASQQAQNPQTLPDAADKAAHPAAQFVDPRAKASENYFKQEATQPFMTKMKHALVGDPNAPEQATGIGSSLGAAGIAIPAEAAPAGLSKLANYLGSSRPLRVGTNTAMGAVQGALNNPSDLAGGATKGGLIALGTSMGGEALAGTSNKIADYVMQKSVGLRKYLPGIGNILIDQGMVGTKNMMANQAENKLATEEANLQNIVQGLQGSVSSRKIAAVVADEAQKFKLPSSGKPSPFSAPELQKVRSLTKKLNKMGDLSPEDLLALKRHGDYQGFTASGNPATSTEADLGRTGADAARQALGKMDPGVSDALKQEQALILAKKALTKPESIHQGMGSSLFFGKVPGQSLFGSLGAQALQKIGGNTGSLFANPAVVQTITNKSTK